MWNRIQGSPAERPQKRIRRSDDFLDTLGPALYLQVRNCLHAVVSAEIRKLAGGDTVDASAYNGCRVEVIEKLATPEVLAELRRHGGELSPPFEAALANQARGYLKTLRLRRHQEHQYRQDAPNGSSSRSWVESTVPVPAQYLPRRPNDVTPVPVPVPYQPPPAPKAPSNPSESSAVVPCTLDTRTHNNTDATRVESPVPIPSRYTHALRDSPRLPGLSRPRVAAPPPTEVKCSTSRIPAPSIKPSPAPSQLPQHNTTASEPLLSAPVSLPPTAKGKPTSRHDNPHRVPAAPLQKSSQLSATSPENFRTRAHALARRVASQDSVSQRPNWTSLTSRPYKSAQWREEITSGTRGFVRIEPDDLRTPEVFHVDFSPKEVQELLRLVRSKMGLPKWTYAKNPRRELTELFKDNQIQFSQAVELLPRNPMPGRTMDDIRGFLLDLSKDLRKKRARSTRDPLILSLERDDYDRQGAMVRSNRVHSLLLAREVAGQRGYGSMRRLENFGNEFKKCREDGLELRAEWTNCAGDIATITWVSNDAFICGTTEHSDAHNQQYNKPGNLVLGSCIQGTLKAYPDHRIVRPVVEKGENSTDAMRQSQDPWLYTSVVSSDYDARHDRAYTCGFDRTVKIWKVESSGTSMALLGTWPHEGNVNFVVASKHESGMVATAADVAAEAVRIYHVDRSRDIASSPFRSYSCSRVVDLEGNTVSTDKWAYFPATIQWGRSDDVQHLVAVGYSPRSRTQDDNDIPEDRRGTGEICVWDGVTGERWNIISGSKLNVFEVAWHPTQPCFIAATSPQAKQGVEFDTRIRTQIRVFVLAPSAEYGGKAFNVRQTLDCTAIDINELTIMPNSCAYCYVTAGCTDGKTYVWDTARGDKPVHVLKHGAPVEEFSGDREREDTGVKFCAWGTTPDRFYTGSSDGVVKVWNVRTEGKPLVRDLLEVPGPVSFGQFSPDRSRLVIGDATGRVFFLSVDEEELKQPHVSNFAQLGLTRPDGKKRRPPQLLIPHPEPEPPADYIREHDLDVETGRERARRYLRKRQIILHKDRTVGALQGPNYAETGLYCPMAHVDNDPTRPLLGDWIREVGEQQEDAKIFSAYQGARMRNRPLRQVKRDEGVEAQHRLNVSKDLDFALLTEDTKEELRRVGAEVDMDYDFEYESDERFEDDEDDEDDE